VSSRFIDTGNRLVKESVLLFQPEMTRANLREVHPKIVTRRLWKSSHGDVCPWGASGDRLWGKEAYRLSAAFDNMAPGLVPVGQLVKYEADDSIEWRGDRELTLGDASDMLLKVSDEGGFGKLRPSIFMCRWMTRQEFDITETWHEDLHAITDEEALLEGIEERRNTTGGTYYSAGPDIQAITPVMAYSMLWNAINGETWNRNPRVWRIGYRRRDA
jgi:hypothetical protein